MQLGPTWTALIVLQVAVAVAVLPAALYQRRGVLPPRRPAPRRRRRTDWSARRLALSREGRAQGLDKRLAEFTTALTQRLEADPEIAAVTFADRFPGAGGLRDDSRSRVPARAATAAPAPQDALVSARPNVVAINLFDVFEVPVVAGRGFTAADVRPDATAVIVDDTFVQQVGGNVVGRRVRYARSGDDDTTTSPWYEIVGVVPAFADNFTSASGPSQPGPVAARVPPGPARRRHARRPW